MKKNIDTLTHLHLSYSQKNLAVQQQKRLKFAIFKKTKLEFLAPNISSLFATMYMQIADDFVIFGTQGAACACATYPETFSWLTNTSRLVKRHFAHHSLSLQTKYSKFNICNFAHSFLPQSAVCLTVHLALYIMWIAIYCL